MKDRVMRVLERVRPSFIRDGGNVELVGVDEEAGVVVVRLTGACGGCPMSALDVKNGIERILRQEIPEIRQVKSV